MKVELFDIRDSSDRLKILISDYEELRSEPLNISLAEKACLDAWHINDWLFEESRNNKQLPKKDQRELKKLYREELYEECPQMRILHDLSNTFKHKFVDTPKAKILRASVHIGEFSSEHSKEFDVSRLKVEFGSGDKIDLDDLVKIAIDYWTERLDSSESVADDI